jgi:hypothetical protein
MQLSLRTRLLTLVLSLLLVASGLTMVSLWTTSRLVANQRILINDRFDPVVAVLSVRSDINGARALYLGFQAQQDPVKRATLRADLEKLSGRIDEQLKTITERELAVDTVQDHLKKIQGTWSDFRTTRDTQMIPAILAGDLASAQRLAVGVQAERYASMTESMIAVVNKLNAAVQEAKIEAEQMSRTSRDGLLLGLAGLVVVGGALSWVLVRRISRSVESVIERLGEVAQTLSDSAGSVASQSQNLALGASRQAAALEETSASLTELGATGTSTAEGTVRVDELARSAGGQAEHGATALATATTQVTERLDALSAAVTVIQDASRRMSQVVSGIDSIAVQINLLALNASVEAARAGDAGAGFAVVADEVRNLAQRSAQEVSTTSTMIKANETAVRGIKLISDQIRADVYRQMGQDLPRVFSHVVEATRTVAAEAGGISTANRQQADGISQISQAVCELDGVIQGTAATSEEVAATAEELSAQVSSMQTVVQELETLVRGHARA